MKHLDLKAKLLLLAGTLVTISMILSVAIYTSVKSLERKYERVASVHVGKIKDLEEIVLQQKRTPLQALRLPGEASYTELTEQPHGQLGIAANTP